MNAVPPDDATVVGMFGAFDIDSLHFETRLLIRRVRELTGENERDAVHQAMAERYLRLTDPASAQYLAPRVIVELAPDVANVFQNAGAANEALRQVIRQKKACPTCGGRV